MNAGGIRGCVALTGPGDPVWHGGPDPARIRWILDHTATMGTVSYYMVARTWLKLQTQADFLHLNGALDITSPRAVL